MRSDDTEQAATGFTLLLGGLAFGLALLGSGGGEHPLSSWFVPLHVLAVLQLLLGVLLLRPLSTPGTAWSRLVRRLLAATLLQAYLIPFVHWWRQAPYVPFFALNMVSLLAAVAWLLVLVNQLVSETGARTGRRILVIEGRLGAWAVPVLMLIPPLLAVLHAAWIIHQTDMHLDLRGVRMTVFWPIWLNFVMITPLLFTMAVTWEARLCCRADALPEE